MKLRNSILGLFLLVFTASCGIFSKGKQQPTSVQLNDNSLLWEISGNGLQQPSYCMGTVHMICKDDYFWNSRMEAALKKSAAIVLELDVTDFSMQMKMAKMMVLGGDTTLGDYLPKSKLDVLQDYFSKSKNPQLKMAFKKLKPSMTAATLAMEALPCKDIESYEMNIVSKAKKGNKEVYSLETLEEQMGVLNSGNYKEDAEALYDAVLKMKSGEAAKQFKDLVATYKKQNIDGLEQIIVRDPSMGKSADRLLYQRNKNWVKKLPAMMASQSLFIAVGAGHLGGKEGVLELLRKSGYTVKAIK